MDEGEIATVEDVSSAILAGRSPVEERCLGVTSVTPNEILTLTQFSLRPGEGRFLPGERTARPCR
jgi:hypothetical protein